MFATTTLSANQQFTWIYTLIWLGFIFLMTCMLCIRRDGAEKNEITATKADKDDD